MSVSSPDALLRDIRIIAGNPTEEEIAGVVAALLLLRHQQGPVSARPAIHSAWSCPARALGIFRPGTHSWKTSSLPR